MTIAMGTCPVCEGSTRKPVPESSQRYIKYNARWGHWGCFGYEPAGPGPFQDGQGYEGGTYPCGNCGGQTMEGRATGQVPLRPDGSPCAHEYVHTLAGNCYHRYDCKHCGYRHFIDSGD
jgi:hypothetical protein